MHLRRIVSRFAVSAWLALAGSIAAAAPAEKIVDVSGVKLRYLTEGKGPPVVLIHGFTHTAESWRPLFAELAKTHTVIAPDLPGLGKSGRMQGAYDKKSVAATIRSLVQGLGYKQADVVGHDIGLMVAYAYASQFPQDVARLVVLEAPLPGIAPWEQIVVDPRVWHFGFTSPTAEKLVAGRERIYLDRFWNEFAANPKAVSEQDRRFYTKVYAQPGAMKAAFSYFAAFGRDATDNKIMFATQLQMPVLAIGGEQSLGQVVVDQARAVAVNVDGHVLKGTGHWLLDEAPAETIALISSFLRKETN